MGERAHAYRQKVVRCCPLTCWRVVCFKTLIYVGDAKKLLFLHSQDRIVVILAYTGGRAPWKYKNIRYHATET